MYPNVSAIPAATRLRGLPTRPRFAGVAHRSEKTGESVYASRFRGAPAATAREAADRAAARAAAAPYQAVEDQRTRTLTAQAAQGARAATAAGQQLVRAGYQELTPERAQAQLEVALHAEDTARVRAATQVRRAGNTVPVMVRGTLTMVDAGSDPTVAAARAAELRSADRAPAPVNPLGLALTAPTTADQAASRAWLPEVPNSQAAATAAIHAPSWWGRLTSGRLGDVAPGGPTPVAPAPAWRQPMVLGAMALGAYLFLKR